MAGELPTTPDDDLNRTLADRYRIVRHLGSGGMGTVFEAKDLRLGRVCAVKLLREDMATRSKAQKRFAREAALLGRLVHENIVVLLDAGVTADGQAFLVLEYLRGRTLRAEFQRAGTLSVERTLEIVAQVARGLDHAHALGVIHRDLKPENVMLTAHADGRLLVKLLDFGIARQRGESDEPITATDAGIGTAAYMAPEQARGERTLDAQTDVYALGAVVYEALAGRRPYDGGSYNQTLFQILNTSHRALAEVRPDLPEDLCAAVERALEKSRAKRFASVRDFVTALGVEVRRPEPDSSALQGPFAVEATATSETGERRTSMPQPARPGGAWRYAASAAGGAVLGMIALGALMPSSPPERPKPPETTTARLEAPATATAAATLAPTPHPLPSHEVPLATPPVPSGVVSAKVTPPARPVAIHGRPATSSAPTTGSLRATSGASAEPTSRRPAPEAASAPPPPVGSFPPNEDLPKGYIAESPYAPAVH